MLNFFTSDITAGWDGRIYMRSIPGELNVMELTQPLPCGEGVVPVGFKWDGASSGIFSKTLIFNFPKWKHPVASCRHDWRCLNAKNKKQRKKSDALFSKDVSNGGTWWEKKKGYLGVRIGAFFGVGSNF